ncbi:MAG: hypothetical protein REI11_11655 [Patulibacter sp.]|nr:hypothetical protein [Patulibacter sp.]
MADTAQGRQLTEAHRLGQLALRARSLRDLLALWAVVDPTDLSGTIDTFVHAAVLLAGRDFTLSAGLAARYYALFRAAEGAPGPAPAVTLALAAPESELAGALRGAALKGIVDARRAGLSIVSAKGQGLVKVAGELTKQVLSGGRLTVLGALRRDRAAIGWARAASGSPCTFCRTLVANGVVYKTEGAADFEAHGHCGCSAEPVYRRGRPTPQQVKYETEFQTAQVWARESGTMSSGTSNNALNNYRRWLDAGGPTAGNAGTEGSGA